MAKKTPPVEYIKDGPIMSCLQKPQLMFVRSEKSIFMTKRKMNDDIMKEFTDFVDLVDSLQGMPDIDFEDNFEMFPIQ